MQEQSIFIAHPTSKEQIDALKAVVKALKVKFEIRKENKPEGKTRILESISSGLKEMKDIQNGNIKGSSLNDFLNEL